MLLCTSVGSLAVLRARDMVQTSLLYADGKAENEVLKCQDDEQYFSQTMIALLKKRAHKEPRGSQRQHGTTVQENHSETEALTCILSVIICASVTVG